MSDVLQYRNNAGNTPSTPKVWNNAAFDEPGCVNSDGSAGTGDWLVLQPIPINRLDVLECGSARPTKEEIEREIEEVEREIAQLTRRLAELRSRRASVAHKPGRIVPSKFMEVPLPTKIKFETPVSSNSKWRKRGVSLGPLEIQQGFAQISNKSNSKKPHGIMKEEKEKSLPWKSPGFKIPSDSRPSRRGVSLGPTEIGAIARKTPVKPGNDKLAKIEEKSVSNRRLSRGVPRKPRVVPSRYSLAPGKAVRDETGSGSSVKRTPESVTKMATMLPRIKAVRFAEQSPRDSGRAKRVADLVGRNPFFKSDEGEHGGSSCQDLFED